MKTIERKVKQRIKGFGQSNVRKQIQSWVLEKCSKEQHPRRLILEGSLRFSVRPRKIREILFLMLGSRKLVWYPFPSYCFLLRVDVLEEYLSKGVSV